MKNKGMLDEKSEEETEQEELEELIPIPDRFYLSDEQMKRLSNFKKRVDKALKNKNSKELKELVNERDDIMSEESKEDEHFKKSITFIINRNPLYLKLNIEEIRELFK